MATTKEGDNSRGQSRDDESAFQVGALALGSGFNQVGRLLTIGAWRPHARAHQQDQCRKKPERSKKEMNSSIECK